MSLESAVDTAGAGIAGVAKVALLPTRNRQAPGQVLKQIHFIGCQNIQKSIMFSKVMEWIIFLFI